MTVFPLAGYERLCFLKNVVKNPNIVVGDYTYYDDFETVANFEKNVKYLFDFTGDLYDTEISVALIAYIRPEVKFSGLDALKAQIAADAAEARRLLADI